jgi:site-specific recombinase XerD
MTVLTLVRNNPQPVQDVDSFKQYLVSEGLSDNTVTAYLSDVRKYGVTADTTDERHAEIAGLIVSESSAATTRMRRLSALAKFYGFVRQGEAHNPYLRVRRPTLGLVLPRVVSTQDEARTIIAAQRTIGTKSALRTAAAVALMAGAGLRVSEVCGLRFIDLNPQGSSLRIVDGKGNKTRDVPLSPFVLEVVREYALIAHPERPRPADLLFPYSTRTIQRDVGAASRAAGDGRPLNPHAFRHGFATEVYRNTTDLHMTADILGHASVATSQIYVHLADDKRIDAVTAAL